MNKIILTLICLSSVLVFSLCHKKSKDSCNLNCLNGGTCLNNACKCPEDWTGPNCDQLLTNRLEGDYVSTDYTCDSFPKKTTKSIRVKVDSINSQRLWIGNILVTRDSGKMFKDNGSDYGGTHLGYVITFEGNTMTISYSSRSASINYWCGGHFTKK